MITIREAVKEDAKNIIEYTNIVGGETDFLTYGSDGLGIDLATEEEMLTSYYNNPNTIFLCAFYDDDIVGVGNLIRGKRRANHRAVFGISVRKDYWGRGIASMMLKRLIAFAKSIGVEYIDLKVRSDNYRAIDLYKKFAFEKVAIIPKDMKIANSYYDCDLMVLDLNYIE